MEQNNIVQKIRDVANTYWCMTQYSEITSFMNNTNNAQAIISAYGMYGMPPANRESTRSTWGKWTDYCDWDKGIYKLYIAAKYFKAYSAITLNQENCGKIAKVLDFLEQEKLNADKIGILDPATQGVSLAVLNDIQTKYMTGYSNLNCDAYLADLQKDIIKEDVAEFEQANTDALKEVTLTKVFIYGISVLILSLGVIKLVKK